MKETTLYVCEICGTNYAMRSSAEKCEKGHKKPKKIDCCKYIPINNDNTGYPLKIDVQMEDGKIVSYRRN